MTAGSLATRNLTADETRLRCAALSEILIDCVEGGASVSFMSPLPQARADAFWQAVAGDVAAGRRALLVAEDVATGRWIGTAQLVLAQPENQPHRADVAKVLVHREARRRGVGALLMHAAEQAARSAGKTLLVLDTATGSDAERLYQRMGWIQVGVVPNYALWPDGRPCATTYYYKALA